MSCQVYHQLNHKQYKTKVYKKVKALREVRIQVKVQLQAKV